jgi:glycosyltransferase involved in cell wall biosynthesis
LIDPRLILGLTAAGSSFLVALVFLAAMRRSMWRPPPRPKGIARAVTVSVIMPARDEERDIGRAIESILAQQDVALEIIVVNDHSSDRTGSIADAAALADGRIKVIHNPALPPGWLGKCNAMQHATLLATGEILLFSDADIIYQTSCIATALAELERLDLDFLSLFPRMDSISLWENIVVPTFVGGLAILATPGIEDPESSEALAAGAFLMVRAPAFQAIGGFEPIRGEMADDVALARLLKSKGYRVGFRFAPDLLHVRIYKSNRHAFWGMTKNVLIAIEGRLWLAPFVMILPMFAFWTPLYCAIAGFIESDVSLTVVGAAGYIIPYASMWSGRRLFPFHPLKALLYPLVVVPVFCCMARALYLYLIRGEVAWRGRSIRVRESQAG